MDFVDWRKSPEKIEIDQEAPRATRYHGKEYYHYIDEQIREAEARGEFANLAGMGKPLKLDDNPYVGDKAMGYNLLKSNGFAPPEVELAKEIRTEFERMEARLAKLCHRSRTLRTRRLPPFASEKRTFNVMVAKVAAEYEQRLRELNRKILTLNLATPSVMHQPSFAVEQLVAKFREACPLFE